jgi:rhamnosyltransferase
MEKVIAVMCEMNPDVPLLKESLQSMRGQAESVIIIDNSNKPEIKEALKKAVAEFGNFVTVVWNPHDIGNSGSFAQGARLAVAQGAEWVVTINDDTILAPGTIETMFKAYRALPAETQKSIGLITPNLTTIRGLAFPDGDPVVNDDGGTAEGQLVKTSIFPIVGYWNELLFIDYVDGEFCCRVQMHGFKTLLVPKAVVATRYGQPILRKFLWKTANVPNYKPYRYYFMCRNSIYLYIRNFRTYILRNNHWYDAFWALIIPRYLIKMVLFEDNRKAKLRAVWRGFWDGLRGRMGPMPQ